jgi:hypothetical protein
MKPLSVLLVAMLAAFGLGPVGATESREVKIQPGEHWWAGVIAEAHRMPVNAPLQRLPWYRKVNAAAK